MTDYFVNLPNSSLSLRSLCNLAWSRLSNTIRLLMSLFCGFPSMWCTCSFGKSGLPKCLIMIRRCSAMYPCSTSNSHLYGDDSLPFFRLPSDILILKSSVIGDSFHRCFAACDIFLRCSMDLGFLTYSTNISSLSRRAMPNFIMRFRTVFRETPSESAISWIDFVSYCFAIQSALSISSFMVPSFVHRLTRYYVRNCTTKVI